MAQRGSCRWKARSALTNWCMCGAATAGMQVPGNMPQWRQGIARPCVGISVGPALYSRPPPDAACNAENAPAIAHAYVVTGGDPGVGGLDDCGPYRACARPIRAGQNGAGQSGAAG